MFYLIKEWVVSSPGSGSVGMSTHTHFDHRLDVIARQLTTLNNPNTDLLIMENRVKYMNKLLHKKQFTV